MWKITVKPNSPSVPQEWNQLAWTNSNLRQSTHMDVVNAFYDMQPVYFELFESGVLTAGLKLYLSSNKRLPAVIRHMSLSLRQIGEIIYKPNFNQRSDAKAFLQAEVSRFIKENKVTTFTASGVYGDCDLLISFNKRAFDEFQHDVGYFDLSLSIETLKNNLHKGHQRSINKALKKDFSLQAANDIDAFITVFNQTYKRQGKDGPNVNFIRHLYHTLSEKQYAAIYFVKDSSGSIVAGILLTKFGTNAYGLFSGYYNNDDGAGTFMLWSVALDLKRLGFQKFILGQMAKEIGPVGNKFAVGISGYKHRFGVAKVESVSVSYIFRPFSRMTWKALQNIYAKLSHIISLVRQNHRKTSTDKVETLDI